MLEVNRHASSVTKFLLESTTGLWMWWGACLVATPILASLVPGTLPGQAHVGCLPSWTCFGERSPVHCGVVKSERPRGHSSPGNWQQPPCHPSSGWLWKNPHGRCCLHHSWVCRLESQWPSWRETPGTPFCGCAAPKKR